MYFTLKYKTAHMKRIFYVLAMGAASYTFFSCAGSEQENTSADDLIGESVETGEEEEAPEIPEEMVGNIINSIPSPIETSQLIKKVGAEYDEDYLNPTDHISQYNTNYEQALNLGVYGTDLGFTNIYDQKQDAISYMNNVRSLADELRIGDHFDFGMIKRLVENSSNLDSLLLITTQNFQAINTDLQKSGRQELSLLIILGGWLEGLHLLENVIDQRPKNDQLKERVGEQKVVLDQIMTILEMYKNDPKMETVYKDMIALQNAYEEITIEEKYEGGEMKEIDGVMTYVQNKTTTVYISDKQLENITKVAGSLRDKIIEGDI